MMPPPSRQPRVLVHENRNPHRHPRQSIEKLIPQHQNQLSHLLSSTRQNTNVTASWLARPKKLFLNHFKLVLIAVVGITLSIYALLRVSAESRWKQTVVAAEAGRWKEFADYFPDGDHRSQFDRKGARAILEHYLLPRAGWSVVTYPHYHGGTFDGRKTTDCIVLGKTFTGESSVSKIEIAWQEARVITLPLVNQEITWSSRQTLDLAGPLRKIAAERFPKKLQRPARYKDGPYCEDVFSYYEFLLAEQPTMIRIGARCLYFKKDEYGVEHDSLEQLEVYLESMGVDYRPVAAKYGRVLKH
jgi:hypothetical protein